ncbi:ATP-binding cassette domain-containing protein [Roseobacter sp. CCS2]|uniref:ATP-binding cassette domain-containing protein n=1 Tax=Roseobacter sp. CCS2 TaxID=391593 RepID=UPI0000F401D0|nr:ATP-binding cassette domain-containing protein [Roseobacter sp. CCS2]EBA13964.1 tungstate ABC transporter, ATP-binding protein [Roseobacter sp. CCS2]
MVFPLQVTGAETRRRGKVLVGPVSLHLAGVGATVVIGPNGSGKTSLLGLLHGTARLHAGTIAWQLPMDQARAVQSFVFQRPVMLRRSVVDNIAYPLLIRGLPKAKAMAQALDWAKRVGLGDMPYRAAPSLSGGEQQKLALARAFITAPQVVFLDEPCASLDGRATAEIEAILQDQKAQGTRLVMSTHDMGQARRLADEIVFLRGGQVHETGPAAQFFDAPQTDAARAFLNGDIVE